MRVRTPNGSSRGSIGPASALSPWLRPRTAVSALLLVLFLSGAANAQIARVGSWTTGLTHTVGVGSNRLLVFMVGYENVTDVGITAITYGGQSLTRITGAVAGTSPYARIELWRLDDTGIRAATGNTFVVTYGGATPIDEYFAAATYQHVDQAAPILDSALSANNTGSPNPIQALVNVVENGMAVSAAISGEAGSFTWGGTWTEGTDQTIATSTSSSADNPSTVSGTDTASATHTGPNRLALVVASLRPAALGVAKIETGTTTVGGTAATVSLTNSYVSPVIVCTVQYNNNTVPVVARVSAVTSNSFDVRLQNPSGGAVASETVSYVVVEEGTWTIDGVNLEAWTYTSTVTDNAASWVGRVRTYGRTYTTPVVLGQVQSENDTNWSVFWCQGTARTNPPNASALTTGKTVCEDTIITRLDETVGYIVFEAGHGIIGGVEYEAQLGADTIQGIDNVPPYSYTFNTAFAAAPQIAVVSMAGVDGPTGGWAQSHGATIANASTLFLSIDEDQIADAERNHTTEQVGYVVFEAPFAVGCLSNPDCDDGNSCTLDTCSAGACAHTPTNEGLACDDGVACTDAICSAGSCVFDVDTGQVTVNVKVEGISNAVTRNVTFEITTCGGATDTRTVAVAFDSFGNGLTTLNNVDADAEWFAGSEGHTLRRLKPLSFVTCAASVDLSGADLLIAGDFQTGVVAQDNLVDINDFSILASAFNLTVPAADSTGADATADGLQATADFSVIQANFFTVGDPIDGCPLATRYWDSQADGSIRVLGASRRERPQLRTSIAVPRTAGGDLARADLNYDGVVDAQDVRAFADRHGLELPPDFDRRVERATKGKRPPVRTHPQR